MSFGPCASPSGSDVVGNSKEVQMRAAPRIAAIDHLGVVRHETNCYQRLYDTWVTSVESGAMTCVPLGCLAKPAQARLRHYRRRKVQRG